MLTIIACLSIVVLLWFLQGQRSSIRRHGKRLPRPPNTLPLAGNGIWFLQPRYKLLEWFTTCEDQIGHDTFEITVPSLPPTIVVSDPRNVEHVLKNHEVFVKGEFFQKRSWDLFGNGIINADGDLWKIQRKAGLRFFSNANLKIFIDETLPPLLEDTKKRLNSAATSHEVIDLQDILLELTTRLMGKVAYDMDMPSTLPFSHAFDYASGAISDRFQNPFWRIKEFFFGSRLRRAVHEVKDFGATIVASTVHKRSFLPSSKPNPLQTNLINSLLDHIPSHTVVADSAMNYLSAGRDTTAQSLTWTFYSLLRHPALIPSLLSELSTNASPTSTLTLPYNFIQNPLSLPHTTSLFLESLRLYPPVPIEIKECVTSSTFPDGTYLPAGAGVLWVPWSMARSKRIWGADASVFNPDRWLIYPNPHPNTDTTAHTSSQNKNQEREEPKLLSKTPYEFPVFNGGARACLGKKLAEVLAVKVVAELVWGYEFEEVGVGGGKGPEGHGKGGGVVMEERRSKDSLTLPMEGGLPVRVRRRERENVPLRDS